MIFISELAYSLHLGSDKNRKNVSREKVKTNNSGTTSLPNSAIQNASHLTRVDKHNYRKYDNKAEDIVIVRGTTSLVDDVKNSWSHIFPIIFLTLIIVSFILISWSSVVVKKIEKLKTTLPMLVIILKMIWLVKLLLNLETKNIGILRTKSLKEK